MANTKSAAKRARQTIVRTARNRSTLSALKTEQKKFREVIAAKNKDEAIKVYATLESRLDRAAKKGVIHRNAANRHKSKANRKLLALS